MLLHFGHFAQALQQQPSVTSSFILSRILRTLGFSLSPPLWESETNSAWSQLGTLLCCSSVIVCVLTTLLCFYIKILPSTRLMVPSTCSSKITILPAVITSTIYNCHAVGLVKDCDFCSNGNVHLAIATRNNMCPQIGAAAIVMSHSGWLEIEELFCWCYY